MKLMFKQGSSCQEQLPGGYFMDQEAGGEAGVLLMKVLLH